jgi:hypothetical protein
LNETAFSFFEFTHIFRKTPFSKTLKRISKRGEEVYVLECLLFANFRLSLQDPTY